MASIKEDAARLVEALPEAATWDDLMYAIYVNQKVARGQADAGAGRIHSHQQVRERTKKR
ncbi:MAG TPA: hypothetical protein VM617_03495 [Thermoanaerobaculia bacterium]|nr:hypothetical protein [Thermoanaerobaculia bacterium]